MLRSGIAATRADMAAQSVWSAEGCRLIAGQGWSRLATLRPTDSPRRALLCYVAVAVATLVAYGLFDGAAGVLGYLTASVLPVVALLVGVRLFRPSSARPWYLLAAGQAAFLAGDILWYLVDATAASAVLVSVADVLYLAGYPLIAGALWLFIRHRLPGYRLAPLVDAFAVGVAGVTILWFVHMESVVHRGDLPLLGKIIQLGYPVGDVLLLGGVAYLLLAGRTSGPAIRLMAIGLGLLLAADLLHAQTIAGSPVAARFADTLWMLSYVTVGLVALTPSMRELTEPDTREAWAWRRRHWLVLGTALLVLPLSAVAQYLALGHVDVVLVLSGEIVLALLLLVSTYDASSTATRQDRRYSALLEKASDAFMVVTPQGIVTHVSPATDGVLGVPARGVVGRQVEDLLRLVHHADRAGPGARLAAVLSAPGGEVHERLRFADPAGGFRWLDVSARDRCADPDVGGIVVNLRNATAEVRVHEELARRTELLATAEGIAGLGSWELDVSSNAVEWSPNMYRLMGLDPSTVMDGVETFYALVHPEDREQLRSATNASLASGAPIDERFRIVRPDGKTRFIEGRGAVVRDADGGLVGARGTFLDVTEQHEALKRLRFQALVLASLRESVIVTDLQGRVTYWGHGASAILGHLPHEMLGRDLSSIYPDAPASLATDLSRILDGHDYVGEWEARRKDGTRVWLEVHTTLLWGEDGEPAGFIGLATDVTERRSARTRADRLARAIEQSSETVILTDAKARIEYVNPAFERISGYSQAEALGQTPSILKSGVQDAAFYRAMWAALGDGRPWSADLTNRRKDGTLYEQESPVSPIHDEHGDVAGYVAVQRDVTEERRLATEATKLARERASIAQTIRDINARTTPEAMAEVVARQVGSLTGAATAGLFIFDPRGRAVPYGFSMASGPTPPDLQAVPARRTRFLREQAERGPWIAAWRSRPSHPFNGIFADAGVKAIAYAPVRDGQKVIGFLHLSSASPDAEDELAARLSALVEFAEITGTMIGAALSDQARVGSARMGVSRIIDRNAFAPVFQPIVDLASDKVVGYEGLTRFKDLVPPDVHFAEADLLGLGERLELATMKAILHAARELPANVWLNLNASQRLIAESEDLPRLLATADRAIVLEVTEHEVITDYEAFRTSVARLGPAVKLAVDDAGAGYASLRHIIELKPDVVKLDRGLIVGIETDEARRALVAGIQHFAHKSSILLIAEGVETEAELAALRELEIPLSQGYLLGRPGPIRPAITVASVATHLLAGDSTRGRRSRRHREALRTLTS